MFAEANLPALRTAVEHFSWLLSREYAIDSALKLVGDRFQLKARQREAVLRSSCSDAARRYRSSRQVAEEGVADQLLKVDGFNLLTTIEAALSGGMVIVGRDGCYRDLASMHGSYRKVRQTEAALRHIGSAAAELKPAGWVWYLDQPVSNSGRLSKLIRTIADESGWAWRTELVPDPDAILKKTSDIVVSADSAILDACDRWFNLAEFVVTTLINSWSSSTFGQSHIRLRRLAEAR